MSEESSYQCITCKKVRPGRFTRRKGEASGGWDKGHHLPSWYCWTCLLLGEGRDETEDMAKQAKATLVPQTIEVPRSSALTARTEVMATIPPIKVEVEDLVITDEASYQYADSLLTRIREARKGWTARMERIYKPIRQGLDELYALTRDVDRPLGVLEDGVKGKMKQYKLAEAEQLRREQEARDREAERLRLEAEEKARKATAAKTPQMKAKLQKAATEAEAKAAEVAAQETSAPVRASGSSTRPVKVPRVTDMVAFCDAIGQGAIPVELVSIAQGLLNKMYKDSPGLVALWPGVTIVDDVQIVGR